MKKITSLIENFDLAILEVKKLNISKLSKVDKNIKIARDCLYQLRLEMRNIKFISTRDEVHFFKKQKPYIHGKLFFYLELSDFLINYPISGISNQRNYIKEQLNKLENKKAKDFDFAKYCKLKGTKYDHIYFLREDTQLDLFSNRNIEDPEFSTGHNSLASQIVTFNLLMKFYSNELDLLIQKTGMLLLKKSNRLS
ncbi:MAG: RteC domain-containing protein [Lutibacter sp.]